MMKNKKIMRPHSTHSALSTPKGFTLIELAMVLVVLGLLIGLGASLIGPLTKQAKVVESREAVKNAKAALSGFAVKNGFLPADGVPANTGLSTNIGLSGARTLDAWGRNLSYYVATSLSGSGNACGLTSTDRTIYECIDNSTNTPCPTYNQKSNVAFIVYSNGEDANGLGTTIQPTGWTGGACPTTYCYWMRVQATSDASYTLPYDDIVQYSTLDEIRSAITCSAGSSTAIPSTPTGLTSTVIGTSAIRLDWNAVSTNTDASAIINLTGYNIYRVAGAGTPTLYKFLQNSNTTGTVSYVDTNAGYFNTYTYNVKAVNAFGTESAATANVSDPGAYGTSSIFQTSAATNWNTTETAAICFQFQVQNHTAANIVVANNRMTWTGVAAPTLRYKIAAAIGAYPACPVTGAAGCTTSGTNVALAYTLNANGANTGFVSVTFFNSTTCATYGSVATSNNQRIGFNANTYSIGDATNGLQ